jgi:hypothetical protein
MRSGNQNRNSLRNNDAGVSTLIEYIIISGILMGLFIVMLLLVNASFMEGPANTLTYSAFTDISNGISTRIVDTYIIAPVTGNITSQLDIPDYIAGQEYSVDIGNTAGDDATAQTVTVSRNAIVTNVSIAGVGSTLRAMGNTTGTGLNRISYDSGGY